MLTFDSRNRVFIDESKRYCCLCPQGPCASRGVSAPRPYCRPQPACPTGPTGPQGPIGPTGPRGQTGPTGPFLSSYVEAVGGAQTVENEANVVFDITEENLDVIGTAITVDPTGTVFTITEPGLYSVEWSLDVDTVDGAPLLIGLMEDGGASSAISSSDTGVISSGALIYVGPNDTPYTISLHNYGAPITLTDSTGIGDVSASIRILRFADGPSTTP